MTDNDIINYLRQNNYRKAVKGLYSAFPMVKKYILANNGNSDDAKDIFQDALVILYKKAQQPEFELSSSLQTYVTGICKNVWLAELRRRKKFNTSADLSGFENLTGLAGLDNETEKFNTAKTAFSLLGEKCRQLLTMFYYNNMPLKEIAAALSFADENTAKNQKYRCLQKAKENYVTLIKE